MRRAGLLLTPRRRLCSEAFTLIELLVVIGVLVILGGIIIPAVARAREKGWSAYCVNNLRQIGVAVQLYGDQYSGYYPTVYTGTYDTPIAGSLEWWEYLLPYSMKRVNMLCRKDPWAKNETLQSHTLNAMFAFANKQVSVSNPSAKILISERNDESGGLINQDYPAWQDLDAWEDLLKKDRHLSVSNYLFGDHHVSPMDFRTTVGRDIGGDGHKNETNRHYIADFLGG